MRFLHKFMISGTVLFVSHDTSAVVNLCNKGILLCKGELIEEGSPKIVIEHYLESLYELTQTIYGAAQPSVSKTNIPEPEEYRDMRQSIINSSILRNDVEVFVLTRSKPVLVLVMPKLFQCACSIKMTCLYHGSLVAKMSSWKFAVLFTEDMMDPLLVFISRTVWARMFLSITPILLISIRK